MHPRLHRQRVLQQGPGPLLRRPAHALEPGGGRLDVSSPPAPPGSTRSSAATRAIVSMQTLAFRPDIAQQCLQMLASWQGARLDPWRDEEPGKILHELRRDEMSAAGELPYSALLRQRRLHAPLPPAGREYYAWTADLASPATSCEPALLRRPRLAGHLRRPGRRRLSWSTRSGRAKGLVNQGWKDSRDSIIHADGTLAQPPIALVEVQGYVYAAKKRLAPSSTPWATARRAAQPSATGDQPPAAASTATSGCRTRASTPWPSTATSVPAAAITSNPGHALWTRHRRPRRAAAVAEAPHAQRHVQRLGHSHPQRHLAAASTPSATTWAPSGPTTTPSSPWGSRSTASRKS